MVNGWRIPRVGTRLGAAHRRRGQPCQDSSLLQRFTLRDGLPLTLLAVADGHGGSSYVHSDVGSALACRVVAELLATSLATLPPGHAARGGTELLALRRWLAAELPQTLHERWLAAVRRHWLEDPDRAAADFTPLAYGTTVGFLLLAPRWWAQAGVGDWDLVRVGQGGDAELLSQEVHGPGAGEVTGSLCQDPADVVAGFRSWVWPLAGSEAPFALALSTDGIRKSCASDADFLALAAWLAVGVAPQGEGAVEAVSAADRSSDHPEEPPAPEGSLADALDRISAEGCGDDVSVATVHWGTMDPLPQALGAGPGPVATGPAVPVVVSPALPTARREPPGLPPPGLAPPALPRRSVSPLPVALAVGLAVLGAAALRQGLPLPWLATGAGSQPSLAPLTQASLAPLRTEVARLCANPALVGSNLNTRRSQLLGLRRGALRRDDLLAAAAQDPLGALIAAGFDPERPRSFRQTGLTSLGVCPALRTGLEALWRLPDSPVQELRPPVPPTPAAFRRDG